MDYGKWCYQWTVLGVTIVVFSNVHALTLTKDTVYESKGTSWHDSVSLLNRTPDTIGLKLIQFSVPSGKSADVEIGVGDRFGQYSILTGIVIHSSSPRTFNFNSGLIPPGGKISIVGFKVDNCIECPLAQNGMANSDLDTLTTFLIFNSHASGDTVIAKDTLVLIGDIYRMSDAIFRVPSRRQVSGRGGSYPSLLRWFNILGQHQLRNIDGSH